MTEYTADGAMRLWDRTKDPIEFQKVAYMIADPKVQEFLKQNYGIDDNQAKAISNHIAQTANEKANNVQVHNTADAELAERKSRLMKIRHELGIDLKKARDDLQKAVGYLQPVYDGLENLGLLSQEEGPWVAEMRNFLQAHYQESDVIKLRQSVTESLQFIHKVTSTITIARRNLRRYIRQEENVLEKLEESMNAIGDLIDAIAGREREFINDEVKSLKEDIQNLRDRPGFSLFSPETWINPEFKETANLLPKTWFNKSRGHNKKLIKEKEAQLEIVKNSWDKGNVSVFADITTKMAEVISSLHTIISSLGLVGTEETQQQEALGKVEKSARILQKVLKKIDDAGAKDMYKAKQLLTDELPTELVKELKEINTFEEARIEFGNTLNELFTAVRRLRYNAEGVLTELNMISGILAAGSTTGESKVTIRDREENNDN